MFLVLASLGLGLLIGRGGVHPRPSGLTWAVGPGSYVLALGFSEDG